MSLLTKEQQTIFGNIRQAEANAFYNPAPGCGNQFMNARVAAIELLSIIDDLQARSLPDTGKYWLEATPEQIKDELERGFHNGGDWEPDAIIRAHQLIGKQYTEQELREWFENRPLVQDEIDALLHEVVPGENEAWYSVLTFAAHVGALKAEQ